MGVDGAREITITALATPLERHVAHSNKERLPWPKAKGADPWYSIRPRGERCVLQTQLQPDVVPHELQT